MKKLVSGAELATTFVGAGALIFLGSFLTVVFGVMLLAGSFK